MEIFSVNHADVKELIPEFYYLPEFLRSGDTLSFGQRSDGQHVGDVLLPPWARGDPDRFVRIMRAALESEYVSQVERTIVFV